MNKIKKSPPMFLMKTPTYHFELALQCRIYATYRDLLVRWVSALTFVLTSAPWVVISTQKQVVLVFLVFVEQVSDAKERSV